MKNLPIYPAILIIGVIIGILLEGHIIDPPKPTPVKLKTVQFIDKNDLKQEEMEHTMYLKHIIDSIRFHLSDSIQMHQVLLNKQGGELSSLNYRYKIIVTKDSIIEGKIYCFVDTSYGDDGVRVWKYYPYDQFRYLIKKY